MIKFGKLNIQSGILHIKTGKKMMKDKIYLIKNALFTFIGQINIATYRNLSPKKKKIVKLFSFFLLSFFLFLLTDLIFPLPPTKTYSQIIRAEDNSLLCAYLTPDDKWRLKTSLKEIHPDMLKAIINKEDAWFYWHYGINPVAVFRAFFQNVGSAKRVSGASTITMQLARMSSPASRTYATKFKEMFRALQYEWHYSKTEILEMYLSYLPYGGNIEGVHSASYLYFNRSPEKLSLSQAILLAVIPNRPNSLRLDKNNEEPLQMRNKWIRKFKEKKVFSDKILTTALEEPIPFARFEIPPQTPQLCNLLRTKEKADEVKTTLNIKTQNVVQNLLKNHVERVKGFGITNGAVLVIDNQTHNVVAYCGSADFGDEVNKGQVNGITALRSPGSALKPIIYALGFDKGIVTPMMKLPDVPSNFSGYQPDNFDMKFRGMVTVHTALAYSLNLPPVWLLREVGYNDFLDILEKAEFSDIKKRRDKLGYSVALGGCGVTLEEMTRFYSTFANGGKMYPISYVKQEKENSLLPFFNPKNEEKAKNLFSPAATYLIGNILADLERPDLPQSYVMDSKIPKIAWKTGTSYGKRDAWSMGFSPKYTVGIWMGNMNGEGAPELTGATVSVPLLIDIFNSIDYNPDKKWFAKPDEVLQRKVCAETGMLPNGAQCSHIINDYYIKNVSPLNTCNLYQEFYVSENEDIQFCPVCLPQSAWKKKFYAVFPPEVALWMKSNHVGYSNLPLHNPKCTAHHTGEGPAVVSPAENTEYYLEKGQEQQILLQAAADADVNKLHWYINGQFYKTVSAGEAIFYAPNAGDLQITCVDDKGKRSQVKVKVRFY